MFEYVWLSLALNKLKWSHRNFVVNLTIKKESSSRVTQSFPASQPLGSCQLSHWHCLIPSFYSPRTLIVQILLCHHSPAEDPILHNLVQHILSGWFIEMYDLLQDSIASDYSFEWYSPLSLTHARRFCGFGISIQMQLYTSVGVITQPVIIITIAISHWHNGTNNMIITTNYNYNYLIT